MDLVEKKNKNIDNRHPWELSRFDCIYKEIRKYHKPGNFLDIGCGDSYFDERLLKTNLDIHEMYGVDIFLDKIKKFDDKRYHVVNNYDKLKNKKFDTIIMMDVLEHIEDDNQFISDIVSSLLNKNGKVIITIPAFQFLYSHHDEFLKHYRRYNIKMIKEVFKNNNYRIVNYHYFYFSLFLFRLLFRNTSNEINNWKYGEKSIITRLYKGILNIDYSICRLMNKLSIGLSLFVVVERNIDK